MLETNNKQFINAADEFDNYKNQNIDNKINGERGGFKFSSNSNRWPAGTKSLIIAVVGLTIIILSYFVWRTYRIGQAIPDKQLPSVPEMVSNILPPLNLQPKSFDTPSTSNTTPTSISSASDNKRNNLTQTVKDRRLAAELKDNSSVNAEANATNNNSSIGNNNDLQNRLQPLSLEPSVAGILGKADYLLTQGAMLDCQLETRLITTQPGMTSCYLTRNIFSTNGKMLLLERGSKIVGNYQGGITQGQARIFVLWSRIETPKGIIINLDSPGTGPLGESGVGGRVDNHFWQRFGGAVMISLIGDFGEYLSKKGQKESNNTTVQFANTTQGAQQAAVEALKNSINIPPTLYKNQGERVSIFIARDLDFSKVYAPK